MKYFLIALIVTLSTSPAEAHWKHKKHHSSKHKNYFKFHSHKYKGHIHKNHCGHDKPEKLICSQDERIINGDFEDDIVTSSNGWQLFSSITGWNISWVIAGTCNSPALAELQSFPSEQLDGSSQYAELDSDCLSSGPKSTNMKYEQLIPAQVGEIIKLEFDYKPRMLNNGKMELTVKFGSNTIVLNQFSSTNWKSYSKDFQVKSQDLQNGKVLVSVADTGLANTYGIFVDNISAKATNCIVTPKMCTSAASVVAYSPAGSIPSHRKNSANALGQPNGEPVNESNVKFTSLGFGGSIVLKLDAPVKNVVGPDLRIWEVTGGNQGYYDYQEEADVYASMNGSTWTLLGRVFNDNNEPSLGDVDLGILEEALYIKIVDQSPQVAGRDGFDVDSVTCVNQANEFEGDFYYVDNTTRKIYKGAVEGNVVFTKEVMDSPFARAHIDMNDDNLVIVEATGDKRIKEIDLESEEEVDGGKMNFQGSLNEVTITNDDTLIVNKAGSNKLYSKHLESSATNFLGEVYYNGKPLPLQGGDMTHNLADTFYLATQVNGGSLYRLEYSFISGRFEATLIAKNLGAVSGLTEHTYSQLIVSILNSTNMKMVDVFSGEVRDLKLKGDLKKQGSSGDLAGYDSL